MRFFAYIWAALLFVACAVARYIGRCLYIASEFAKQLTPAKLIYRFIVKPVFLTLVGDFKFGEFELCTTAVFLVFIKVYEHLMSGVFMTYFFFDLFTDCVVAPIGTLLARRLGVSENFISSGLFVINSTKAWWWVSNMFLFKFIINRNGFLKDFYVFEVWCVYSFCFSFYKAAIIGRTYIATADILTQYKRYFVKVEGLKAKSSADQSKYKKMIDSLTKELGGVNAEISKTCKDMDEALKQYKRYYSKVESLKELKGKAMKELKKLNGDIKKTSEALEAINAEIEEKTQNLSQPCSPSDAADEAGASM